MQKRVFSHMRKAKTQISLSICAVWSGPSLSAHRIIGYTECMNEEQRPGWYFVHSQVDLNLCILRVFDGNFSLHAAQCKIVFCFCWRNLGRKNLKCVSKCIQWNLCKKVTFEIDFSGVKRWLSYKDTCHVILLAKLHDMYLYKTDNFFHIYHYLKSVSKVAFLHRFHCTCSSLYSGILSSEIYLFV